MDGRVSEEDSSTALARTGTITTAPSRAIQRSKRIVQDLSLIWIHARTDQSKDEFQNTLAELQSILSDVNTFTQPDEGVDFLTEVHDGKDILIIEDTIGQGIVPLIHDVPQLDAIYILRDDKTEHEQRITQVWAKIKGIYTSIKAVTEALQQTAQQYNEDSIAMSFITGTEGDSNQSINQLEPSFMYTQILKEIVLEIKHDEQSIQYFIQSCRDQNRHNIGRLNELIKFECDYSPQSAITWYTRDSFICTALNQSLRLLKADEAINMGFFIRDLHQQIVELYKKQVGSYNGKSFTVFRGQGLSKTDFDKLRKNKDGLMSFNSFLSTSRDRDVSRFFTESPSSSTNTVGILFVMTVDPSVSSVPFASIQDISCFPEEGEILFSMHTVFRIGEITRIDNHDSVYQVNLTLTADDDEQLRILTEFIRKDIACESGWSRLGQLLIKLDQCNKAEELYNALLEQTSSEYDRALYYHQLGCIKDSQGKYTKAIEYYEKAIEIRRNTRSPNYLYLATSYNNIGAVYEKMGKYSQALSLHEKALAIRQILPPNHADLAQTYSNIGVVYNSMADYPKALLHFEKALKIDYETLSENNPNFAASYTNIAGIHKRNGEYSKALWYYEKALQIDQRALPPNHSDRAVTYNNIGNLYVTMKQYAKALSSFEKALEIGQGTLPPDHHHLAVSYNNIAGVHYIAREYAKALSFHKQALEIRQKSLSVNHPHFIQSYSNIGLVYQQMNEYSRALAYFEQALEICQRIASANDPNLAACYESIAITYHKSGEYSKALSYYERALEIFLQASTTYRSHIEDIGRRIDYVKDKLQVTLVAMTRLTLD